MPKTTQRPCSVCRRWFRPDVRVGKRQHTCSRKECQVKRRQKNQALWRARNPDYFHARRIQARSGLDPTPEPLRLPPPLSNLPWDIAQKEIGVAGADFMGIMGALLLRVAQDQFPGQPIDNSIDLGRHAPPPTQDQLRL